MFGWNDSLAVGVPMIDAQHKQLFNIVAELHEAMRNRQSKQVLGGVLQKLIDYTVKHFSTEEALLRSKNYSGFVQHERIHEQFAARMKKFKSDYESGASMVNVDLMLTLEKWLVEHIEEADVKYAKELRLRTA